MGQLMGRGHFTIFPELPDILIAINNVYSLLYVDLDPQFAWMIGNVSDFARTAFHVSRLEEDGNGF